MRFYFKIYTLGPHFENSATEEKPMRYSCFKKVMGKILFFFPPMLKDKVLGNTAPPMISLSSKPQTIWSLGLRLVMIDSKLIKMSFAAIS